MSTTSLDANIAPRWNTYLKAVAFASPAIIAWGLACVYLVPKLREICRYAGVNASKTGWLWDATFFFVQYGRALLIAGILIFVLFELLGRWPRQRRLTVNIVVWIANVIVLFGLLALLILALIAAPGLSQPR
jgi:hypothetical protein